MLQSFLEILDLPRNTVAQIARAFGVRPQSKRTFAGLPKITGQDILRHAGALPSQYLGRNLAGSTADFLAGFVTDVATDPLSWVTLGTSSLLGTGARRIGQTTLTRAGSKALEQRAARLLERVGRRAARGVTDPDLAREAAEKARREWLERLGERPTREAWQAAAAGGDVEAAARLASRPSPLARRYLAGEGQRLLSERLAQRVARRPGMRDVTALGLSTRGVKEFQPFDLPAAVGTALTSVLSPRAGEALGRGYQAFRRATGPVLNPLSWALPRADVTLLSRAGAGRIAERLGLGRLGAAAGRAIEASPLASAAARGLSTLGETLQAKFRTEPRPPRPGDPADQVRYEAEKFARFVDREVAARQRGILYDEPPKIRKWIDQATNISGAPRAAVADAIAEVAEMLPSLREGQTSGAQIAEAVRRTVRDYGGKPEQAEQLAAFVAEKDFGPVTEALAPEAGQPRFGKFWGDRPPARELNLFGEPIEVVPEQGSLFSARELEAGRLPEKPPAPRERPRISDGLRSATAQALGQMPGRRLPGPKQLRKWLIEQHGSGRLAKLLSSPVYSKAALQELREAIEQAGKGRSLFGEEALAPLERKLGGKIKLVDSERFDYEATLRVVDAEQLYGATGGTPVPPGSTPAAAGEVLLPSHRPKRDKSGKVVGFEPVAGYNAEAQARMPGERNAAVVAAIAREPRLEELNEFGTLVTDGPPVVYAFEPGRLHTLAGNHRLMGMSLWDAGQWRTQREFVAAAYGPLPPEIKRPILVRELRGTPEQALRLAANSQEAPTARQSLIELANAALAKRGIARGDIDALPGVVIREPVTRDNVRALVENPANADLRALLFRGLSEAETAKRLADPEQLAETVNELFTAMLPRSVQNLAARLPARYEPMFVAAAPLGAYLHSLRRAGLIRPEYDLYDALEQGAQFFERLTRKRGSYSKIIQELDEIAATPTFAGMGDELSRATQRGLAVAVGLVKAGRSKDPAGTFVTAINEVIAAARADDPRQIGMFGIEPATAAAQSYLNAFVGGQQARSILDRMGAIRERELARGIGEGLGTGETPVPPDGPPVPPTPPTGVAPPPSPPPPPPSDRQRFLADIETYWRGRGLPEQQLTGVRAILEHMHDDVFRGLRLRAGSEAEAQALAARHGMTPAASHTKLTAAEQVREKAQGLIRLFNRSRESDDMDLVLEELWHHVHNVILSDAERAAVRAFYESNSPAKWAELLRGRPRTGGRLAAYYARDPNELSARLFSDYVMGREIAAGTPEVRGIFSRALDALVRLWRQLTGAGLVDVSPRLEAIFSRYYRSPVASGEVGARITGETPVPPSETPVPPGETPVPAAGRTPPPPGPPRPVRQPLLPGMETPEAEFGVASREPIEPPAGPQGEIPFPPREPPGPKGKLVLADPVREAAEYIVARGSQRIAEEQAADLPSARLTTEREIGYLMRFLVDDPKSQLGKLLRRAGIKLGSATQLRRLDWAREKFTHEINQIVMQVNDVLEGRSAGDARAQQIIESLQLKRGEQLPLYLMDPVIRHTARELESVRRIGSAEFLREIVRRHGVRIGQGGPVPAGYTKVETQQLGEWARDYAFPQEVARVLEQHVHRLSRPDPILRGYRTVLGLWKGWALVAPAYHLRNLLGNVWNMHLVDGFEPQAFAEARRMQRAIAGGDEFTLGRKIKGTEESYGSLYRKLLVEHGLVGSGFFGTELGVHLTRMEQLLEQMDNPTSFRLAWNLLRRGHPLRANQTLGQIAEESSKIALVIARLRKGDSLGQAVELTQRALFDYGDLTDFERGTHTTPGLRDVIPFYTWTRKNIGLLATMALAEPRKLAAVPKLQMGIEQAAVGEEALPDSLRPAHIAKEGGIQVTGGTRPRFVNLGYMLPVGELRLVNPLAPRQAARGWLEQAGGPARTALELATNYDTFFDRPIREYAGQRKEFLGLDVPPELKHVARTIRPLNQLEQFRRLAEGVSPAAAAGGIAANLAGVRAFPVDAGRQVFQAERTINEQLGAIRRDMRWRMRQIEQGGGDPAADGELKRLALEHERLRQQREQLPLAEQRALVRPLSRRRQEKLIGYLEQMQSQPN